MGRRSQTDTLAGIYQAFIQRRTWKQAELAREVGVTSPTVRRVLRELEGAGMPLQHDDSDPPHIYWSVGKDWYPGSVVFKRAEVPELLRQIRRLPQGQGRRRLLGLVLDQLPEAIADAPSIWTPELDPQEEQHLSVVEDSIAKIALLLRYYSASRGDVGTRRVSVHRLRIGPPARFIATCHRTGTLKTFRVDGILSARLDPAEPFRRTPSAAVEAYDTASLDGLNEGGTPRVLSFLVRSPESRWVKNNLLPGMRADAVEAGERVTVETTAISRVARFVVGLGAAATPETPALATAVAEIARGALATADSTNSPPGR